MSTTIKISSQFGHEIMALKFAKSLGATVYILPKKETKEEFDAESKKIYDNLSSLYSNLKCVDFEEKETYEAKAWDVIGDLKAEKLYGKLWDCFAENALSPDFDDNLPQYSSLKNKENILMVPQKLISDGECGINAEQQSLPLQVFDFLKGSSANLVLGQHFHKENDLAIVQNLAEEFDMYVPGMTENKHVFGIRGVQHKEYFNMYASLNGAVGIAGTHTWIMLTCFPEIPQVILYNKHTVERWDEIGEAFQKQGYKIYCLGYDETTDLKEFSKQIEEKCNEIF